MRREAPEKKPYSAAEASERSSVRQLSTTTQW